MPVLPYGSWPSPITPESLVEQVVRLGEVRAAAGALWWIERRPAEAGREVVVRWTPEGGAADAVPEGFSVRTTVHEYGGGAYTVAADGTLVCSRFDDQRLYAVRPGADPEPVTPAPDRRWALRYADGAVLPGGLLMCVREQHLGEREVVNDLVAVRLGAGGDEPAVIASGRDFYAAPRPSPDGRRLAWLCWDHPDMPWDATELWVGDLALDGTVQHARRVAGGDGESISQPRWSPDGSLHWISDRTGWWNLYREGEALAPMDAELALPDWVFGQSSYTFLSGGRIACAWQQHGSTHLGVLEPGSGLRRLDVPFTVVGSLQAWGDGVAAIAASPREEAAVVTVDVASGAVTTLRRSREGGLDAAWISEPRHVSFPTTGGATAHALYYPPVNPDAEGPAHERPPVVVTIHGGPTSAAQPALSLATQFWTTRGIGVVDVNYRGSTGYGRPYRDALRGEWGEADVDDCEAAVAHLAEVGEVDGDRAVIRGGSAGGFTTLCALAFRDAFAAGASLYGVADLAALAADTHKFESRYLDRLVGPWPDAEPVYRARSPLYHADLIRAPVILFQGLEDAVVPPNQAEVLVEALRANGVPFAYLAFEGEQHGFRKAETIVRVAGAELWFYGLVLGFEPAGELDPVEVENLDALYDGDGAGDDGPGDLAWDLSEWEPQLRVLADQALEAEGIPHVWDEADLIVPAAFEEHVEAILDELEYPDALEIDDSDEADDDTLPELLSELFVAVDRLARDPGHPQSVATVLELAGELEAAEAPYGVEPGDWRPVVEAADALADALADEADADAVRAAAGALRRMLHRYV